MSNFIVIKKLNLQMNFDEINIDAIENEHSKLIFDFSHQMITRLPNEGNPNKFMNEILDYKVFDFNLEFDKIIFKTLLKEYITYINTYINQMTSIFDSGVKRFFDSPQGKINNEINLIMINRFSEVPQMLLDSSLDTMNKLSNFIALRKENLDIQLEFDEVFLGEKIKEVNEWYDELKQSLEPKKWWQF